MEKPLFDGNAYLWVVMHTTVGTSARPYPKLLETFRTLSKLLPSQIMTPVVSLFEKRWIPTKILAPLVVTRPIKPSFQAGLCIHKATSPVLAHTFAISK
jgi:hypothetical protein